MVARATDLDLGVPLEIEEGARSELESLPPSAIGPILSVLRRWIAGSKRVVSVSVSLFVDPEEDDWSEILFELFVDSAIGPAMKMWEDLGRMLDEEIIAMRQPMRELVAERIGIHVLPKSEVRSAV